MTRSIRAATCAALLSVALGCGGQADPEAERHREAVRAAEYEAAYTEGLAHVEAGAFDPAVAVAEFEIAARLMPRDEIVKALLAAARQAKVDADRERYKQAVAEV